MSNEPFTVREVCFSIASLPPMALTYLSTISSTVREPAHGLASAGLASVFGFSCAATASAAIIEKTRTSAMRFILLFLSVIEPWIGEGVIVSYGRFAATAVRR